MGALQLSWVHRGGAWSRCPPEQGPRPVVAAARRGDHAQGFTCGGKGGASVEGCLLHDPQELLLVDLAVAVPVRLVDHLLQLLVRHVLAELLGHPLEVRERDLARVVVVKEAEGLEDLFSRVLLAHLLGHHLQELVELDRPRAVLVDLVNHLFDLLLLGLKAERAHRHLELLGIDSARAVGIEQVECLADLLLLLLSQLRLAGLALPARVWSP
mmetsp:Transcript_32998/g.109007  ORF Transcript_32998/g.109007 Transcript_32998/m.109007 type:complete len:213 (+) Transcript_32998:265-903(+)